MRAQRTVTGRLGAEGKINLHHGMLSWLATGAQLLPWSPSPCRRMTVALCFAVAGTMTGSIILTALLGGVDLCDEVPNAEAAVETKSAVRMPRTKGLPIAAWPRIFPVEARESQTPRRLASVGDKTGSLSGTHLHSVTNVPCQQLIASGPPSLS
jgi:hypothetical protein